MEVLNYQAFKVTDSMMAGHGKRLGNYLIDVIVFYIIMILIGIAYGLLIVFAGINGSPEDFENINPFLNLLITISIQLTYYTFMEYKLGKTVGKFITGTKVVYANGDSINLRTAILRSLSRIVPFEAFSLLGTPPRGWHDDWTDTYVVNEKIFDEQKEHFYNFKDLGIERYD
jgi:uncharacterized RDD family membrane protein YckC